MSYSEFKSIFHEILRETPLPNGDTWDFKSLQNIDLRNEHGWMEVLYRTRATYQCNHRHQWESSWTMILFRFQFDVKRRHGKVRIKRFGQRCNKIKCADDEQYHLGFCPEYEVWHMVQSLLLNILQRCYEERPESDVDETYYIIPVSDVPKGRFGGGSHQQHFCEACAHDKCQHKFKKLTKKKT